MTATTAAGLLVAAGIAYERFLNRLDEHNCRYRNLGGYAMAQCPSHDDRRASLAIYRKPGRVKLVCYAGCDDELDILPALGLAWPDKYDEPRSRFTRANLGPGPATQAHIEARRKASARSMTFCSSPILGRGYASGLRAPGPSFTSGSANCWAVMIVNEEDRIHFELRNELAQEVEIGGRTGLAHNPALFPKSGGNLQYVQKKISELARKTCLDAQSDRGDQQ